MSEKRSGLGLWPTFAVITALAVVAIVWLVKSGERVSGAESGRPVSMSAADSAARADSIMDVEELEVITPRMSLREIAGRVGVSVDSLVAEMGLPATVSRTAPLRNLVQEYHFTLKDVFDARERVRGRL